MNKKLIAFDIDGTLLNSNRQPLESTIKALDLLRKDGHIVTIATGRSYFLAENVIKQLNFDNYILCNGSAAFTNHKQIFKNTLDKKELLKLIEQSNQLNVDVAALDLEDIKRVSNFNEQAITSAMSSFGASVPDYDPTYIQHKDIYQALAYFDESLDEKYHAKFPAFNFVRWHQNSVDVIPAGGSKATTVLHMADHLNIAHEDTIAFGDGFNDFEMLSTVGVGVAMANGQETVKNVANMVTDSNDQDGIWNALKKMALI